MNLSNFLRLAGIFLLIFLFLGISSDQISAKNFDDEFFSAYKSEKKYKKDKDKGKDKAQAAIPRPEDTQAYWAAEEGEKVDSKGGIVTANGLYKGSHRKCAGAAGSQPSSPFWQKVSSPKYQGKSSWKVVSQPRNGRNEQRILRDYDPLDYAARWFSFAVNIDPSAPSPGSHFFFAQLHQVAHGMNPPVFLSWTGSKWEFVIRTDNGIAGKNMRTVLASGTMKKGQWYHFKMKLRPGLNGTAVIALWLKENGTWQSKSLNWGSNPVNTVGFKYMKPNQTYELADWSKFNFKLGIYRGSYSGAPTVYMDNISYGKKEKHLLGL